MSRWELMDQEATGQSGIAALRRKTYVWAVVSLVLALGGIVAYGSNPTKVAGLVAALLVFPALGLALLLFANWRRARAVDEGDGFSSSSSQQVADLELVPRFAALVGQMQRLDETDGWIGGGVTVDRDGVRWAPTAFSRRVRRVPAMGVGWPSVRSVEVRPVSGTGSPAELLVSLDDGSVWKLNAMGADRLRAAVHACFSS